MFQLEQTQGCCRYPRCQTPITRQPAATNPSYRGASDGVVFNTPRHGRCGLVCWPSKLIQGAVMDFQGRGSGHAGLTVTEA